MYKINLHFTAAQRKKGIHYTDMKYLDGKRLLTGEKGLFCKKHGENFIVETNMSDSEQIRQTLTIATAFVMTKSKPFTVYL